MKAPYHSADSVQRLASILLRVADSGKQKADRRRQP